MVRHNYKCFAFFSPIFYFSLYQFDIHTKVTSNNTKYIPHQSSTTSSSNVAGTSLSNGISDSVSVSQQQQQQLQQNLSDKICFNFGKELYVYSYRGVKKVSVKSIKFLRTFPKSKCLNLKFNSK